MGWREAEGAGVGCQTTWLRPNRKETVVRDPPLNRETVCVVQQKGASDLLGRMADFDYQLKKKNHKSIFSVQQITCYS